MVRALYDHAWIGSALYVLVLLGVAVAISSGIGRLDAFEAGELNAGLVRQGQWWRAWTALTLHLDPAHIAANIGAGAWFGYLAGRLLGPGTAWALVVLGAGAANWVEAMLAAAAPVLNGAAGLSVKADAPGAALWPPVRRCHPVGLAGHFR